MKKKLIQAGSSLLQLNTGNGSYEAAMDGDTLATRWKAEAANGMADSLKIESIEFALASPADNEGGAFLFDALGVARTKRAIANPVTHSNAFSRVKFGDGASGYASLVEATKSLSQNGFVFLGLRVKATSGTSAPLATIEMVEGKPSGRGSDLPLGSSVWEDPRSENATITDYGYTMQPGQQLTQNSFNEWINSDKGFYITQPAAATYIYTFFIAR